jgi:hypothetical protein
MIINYELDKMWEEELMAYFRALGQRWLGRKE